MKYYLYGTRMGQNREKEEKKLKKVELSEVVKLKSEKSFKTCLFSQICIYFIQYMINI